MIWGIGRYLFIIGALFLLGLSLPIAVSQPWAFPLGTLLVLVAIGYALVAPIRALRKMMRTR